eukprot:snap_masked-scaffold_20-processed-gene-0.37-mRNA-1 protein AED:1.00 eAED:1.00 QI:0/0/0/0/1/1/2/0/80
MDNFGPILPEILPNLKELIGFLPMLPIADKTGCFGSKIFCLQVPKIIKLISSRLKEERVRKELCFEMNTTPYELPIVCFS